MPQVFLVPVDVELPEADPAVDLFLLQLHSPPPMGAGTTIGLPNDLADRRGLFLQNFSQWIRDSYCPTHPGRPFFIAIPELSLSPAHIPILETLLGFADRPAFIVAGLEFLSWAQYKTLIHQLPHMPAPESWLVGGYDQHVVNAAVIIVRDAAGTVRRFLQTKRNPSDPEATTHFACQNLLVFQSINQSQGSRLNFCVQICADFTNQQLVRDFRKASETSSPGRPIDLTFVLQRNKNQAAPHFLMSVKAYFDPPVGGLVDTKPGCLVFLNNARALIEDPSWGDSMLLFPYENRWRISGAPAPTYWLRNAPAHNHQSVLMRDPGPAAFWLRYKPHYLADPVAGSGDRTPFLQNHALCLTIIDDAFPADPAFAPTPPVVHWLRTAWTLGRLGFSSQLQDCGVPPNLLTLLSAAYETMMSTWFAALSGNDGGARSMMNLYCCAFAESQGFPGSELEPNDWSSPVADASKRFLTTLAILGAFLPAGALVPSFAAAAHATISLTKDSNVTLAWAGGTKPVRSLVTLLLSRFADAPPQGTATRLVVLVSPIDTALPPLMAEIVKTLLPDITHASPDEIHDDITESPSEVAPTFVCDQLLWAAICHAASPAHAQETVLQYLGMN